MSSSGLSSVSMHTNSQNRELCTISLSKHHSIESFVLVDPWPFAGFTLAPSSGFGVQLLAVNLRAVELRIPIGEYISIT